MGVICLRERTIHGSEYKKTMSKLKKNLFERFFNKRSSAEEAKEIFEWLKDEENSNEAKDLFQTRWNRVDEISNLNINEDKENDIYFNILEEIEKKNKVSTEYYLHKKAIKKQPINRRPWIAAVVAVLIFVTGAIPLYLVNFSQEKGQVENNVATVTKITRKGEKLTTKLPDGTRVLMNAMSKIEFPEEFRGAVRKIRVEGEAYFEVAKDIQKPFIVKSGAIETKALGTEFNVRTNRANGEIVVSLKEGKVLVQPTYQSNTKNRGHILRPGEQIIFDHEGNLLTLEDFDYDKSIGWKDGTLYFDEANIDELINKLEGWYGVEISLINRPSGNWRFTSVYKDESLENVLRGLQFAKDISYEIEGEKVKIIFNHKI